MNRISDNILWIYRSLKILRIYKVNHKKWNLNINGKNKWNRLRNGYNKFTYPNEDNFILFIHRENRNWKWIKKKI